MRTQLGWLGALGTQAFAGSLPPDPVRNSPRSPTPRAYRESGHVNFAKADDGFQGQDLLTQNINVGIFSAGTERVAQRQEPT